MTKDKQIEILEKRVYLLEQYVYLAHLALGGQKGDSWYYDTFEEKCAELRREANDSP